jgi:hypothetical protein
VLLVLVRLRGPRGMMGVFLLLSFVRRRHGNLSIGGVLCRIIALAFFLLVFLLGWLLAWVESGLLQRQLPLVRWAVGRELSILAPSRFLAVQLRTMGTLG